jgi:hypothetical protein
MIPVTDSLVKSDPAPEDVVGPIPYRMAFTGGWIDQPFMSKLNPAPPGSMVVVGVEPLFRFMDRCGMATSTREVAQKLWPGGLPPRAPEQLMRELYNAENADKAEPSGSQDMAGLLYPGVSRLDFDAAYEGGFFPAHIESNRDPAVGNWLENVIHLLPVAQRPNGYSPLGEKNLDPDWIQRLSQSGKDCFNAITARNLQALGASMNACMQCWAVLLPQVLRHPAIATDLAGILRYYQARYPGAMYSGCGGGYLYIVSEDPVPGTFQVKVRLS